MSQKSIMVGVVPRCTVQLSGVKIWEPRTQKAPKAVHNSERLLFSLNTFLPPDRYSNPSDFKLLLCYKTYDNTEQPLKSTTSYFSYEQAFAIAMRKEKDSHCQCKCNSE